MNNTFSDQKYLLEQAFNWQLQSSLGREGGQQREGGLKSEETQQRGWLNQGVLIRLEGFLDRKGDGVKYLNH